MADKTESTDGVLKTEKVDVELKLVDVKERKFFRGFGQHLGDIKLEGEASMSVYSFGNIVEVHYSGHSRVVEFTLSDILAKSKILLEG